MSEFFVKVHLKQKFKKESFLHTQLYLSAKIVKKNVMSIVTIIPIKLNFFFCFTTEQCWFPLPRVKLSFSVYAVWYHYQWNHIWTISFALTLGRATFSGGSKIRWWHVWKNRMQWESLKEKQNWSWSAYICNCGSEVVIEEMEF